MRSSTVLPRNPRTGLKAVGWRKPRRGETGPQPIHVIAGGDGTDDPPAGDDGGDSGGDGGEADPPADGDDANKPDTSGGTGGEGEGDKPPEGGEPKTYDEAYVKKLRDENAAARVKAKKDAEAAAAKAKDELTQAIGKAVGLVKDDEPTDPDKLQQQITEQQAETRATKIELAVFRGASSHEADPDALLDSRTFIGKVAKLDPAAEDFQERLSAAIKETVDSNPKFKAAGQAPPAKTGGDFGGGSGDSPPSNQLSVEDQRKARRKRRELDFNPS